MHKVSLWALTLNDASQIGVQIVKGRDMAQLMPVTIFAHEREDVWGGGLPKEATVIVTGQDFVTDGQQAALVNKGAQTRP